MVMAHTLVPGLVERGDVHFLAPEATADLATRMPGVANVHRIATQHGQLGLRERRTTAARLKPLGFDQAIVLPSSFKSALAPFLADIPRRTGFRGELRYGVLNDVRRLDAAGRKRMPRLVDRFAELADAAPTRPVLRVDDAKRQRLLAHHGLTRDRPIVMLCPGADYGGAKRWPIRHFEDLARRCVEAGANVCIVGGKQDAKLGEALAAAAPAVNLAGRTSLLDAVDLLSAASVVVSNDSGLMHVAAAVDVPVVGVYGSTSPTYTPPLSPRATVVESELPCRPCFRRECPFGHRNCLRGISAVQVFGALDELGALATPRRAEMCE